MEVQSFELDDAIWYRYGRTTFRGIPLTTSTEKLLEYESYIGEQIGRYDVKIKGLALDIVPHACVCILGSYAEISSLATLCETEDGHAWCTDSREDYPNESVRIQLIKKELRKMYQNIHMLVIYENWTLEYTIPGGKRDLGEDPETCAFRELHEETKLDETFFEVLGSVFIPSMKMVCYFAQSDWSCIYSTPDEHGALLA